MCGHCACVNEKVLNKLQPANSKSWPNELSCGRQWLVGRAGHIVRWIGKIAVLAGCAHFCASVYKLLHNTLSARQLNFHSTPGATNACVYDPTTSRFMDAATLATAHNISGRARACSCSRLLKSGYRGEAKKASMMHEKVDEEMYERMLMLRMDKEMYARPARNFFNTTHRLLVRWLVCWSVRLSCRGHLFSIFT